ncbi:UNVERIFIED_CONTAM: hypothetical protein GTU68_048691 [Idotea baltica]|nr:hypothetical protein [Idotea baltica]
MKTLSSTKPNHCPRLLCAFVCLLACALFSRPVEAQVDPLPGALPQQIPPAQIDSLQQPIAHHRAQPIPRLGPHAAPIRIKDITTIEGHRSNHVTGFGVVTGLKGTGGKSPETKQALKNYFQRRGFLVDEPTAGNVALVAVNAEIPPFVRPGETIKATVSVADDSQGLFGGVLQTTSLEGLDGQVYALAQGDLILSGFSAEGAGGGVSKNHDTTGLVEAQIEVGMQTEPAFPRDEFRLLLTNKDYATAQRIAAQINQKFPGYARARDQGSVDVMFPPPFRRAKLEFVVRVNELTVVPDMPARVVINQKTGTIVVGQHVKLSKVVFANENLVITTNETPVASQPAPFSEGQTVVLPRTQISATETGGTYNTLQHQTTVGDLAGVLNTLGVRPRDLIGIFQDIQASGALQAQLIIQ